jgi:5-methylcytosine-specific restriction endonuclease McrA
MSVTDRRYSTSAWQRVRKAVLQRDGYQCRIRGPRCTGQATTVHHIIPSSERPDLFFVDENLAAACARCNYADGSRIAAANGGRRIEQLQEIIFQQDQWIQELLERVAQYEAERPQPGIRPNPRRPAIF